MKKSNIISQIAFVWSLGLMSVAPVWAQTCIKTPSCADLGYTKSTTDCSGKTILKCPLDTTKVYCPGAEETLRTYKVGDAYVDENGVGIGIVAQVDSTGKHGVVIFSAGRGDASTATTICSSKTAGNLNWGLASGQNICGVYSGGMGGGCVLLTSSGNGYCYSGRWNVYDTYCQTTTDPLSFYCQASFQKRALSFERALFISCLVFRHR